MWRASGAALALLVWAVTAAGVEFAITPEVQETLDRVSADSLRGRVSFLASDLLEGRATPSPGLDLAAEYIAAQFRGAGLEPAGDDEYFQTAEYTAILPQKKKLALEITIGGKRYRVAAEDIETAPLARGVRLTNAPLVKASMARAREISKWMTEEMRGKAIITDQTALAQGEWRGAPHAGPAVVIVVAPRAEAPPTLLDPGQAEGGPRLPVILVYDPAVRRAYDAMKTDERGAKATLRVPAPVRKPVKLRNVAGLLRGSDPLLSRTTIIVSAHYDHVGICSNGPDRICNGANDDASGVAAVIEIAKAFSKMRPRPKRSFLFLAYFGEERGLWGSRYYAERPLVPLKDTIANLNLEHMGRTNDREGARRGRATLTGFDYSDMGAAFVRAGELTGVTVEKSGASSDTFFDRSDNQPLAEAGVPAHTLLVAFEFGDYHRPGDEWRKLDYANFEKVTRMAAAGLLMLAASPEPPKWNESSVQAERYLRVWRERKGN